MPTLSAITLFEIPSAASRTMRARLTRPCGDDREFAMAPNCSRISWGKITGFLGRPVIMGFLLFYLLYPMITNLDYLFNIFTGHNTRYGTKYGSTFLVAPGGG